MGMAVTRTQTGTIQPKQYDLEVLTGLRLRASPEAYSTFGPQTVSKTGLKIPASPHRKSKVRLLPTVHRQPESMMPDISDGINFFPRRAIGEREDHPLAEIERVERDIDVWEDIKRSHAEGGLPEMVPGIESKIEKMREKISDLRRAEREQVGVEKGPSLGEIAISKRLQTLQWALDTSKFEPEAENIRAAIAGYKSGSIGYTEHFTLIYAGQIVDQAPTYAAFVIDRGERLDRYAAKCGPHWLWHEEPLNVHAESKPQAMGSVALHRHGGKDHLSGRWHVMQGFWKRSGLVARFPDAPEASSTPPEDDAKADNQKFGPRVNFRMVLDSGATHPMLIKDDFEALSIEKTFYASQGANDVLTANGTIECRVYELFVSVLDNDGLQLVSEFNAAFPSAPKYLGGLCRVFEGVGAERLSGMLPFTACYMSHTPTTNTLHLGEDRKDVLGVHRMPAPRRWERTQANPAPIPKALMDYIGDPKTTFWHSNGDVIDEDDRDEDFVTILTCGKGKPDQTVQRTPEKMKDAPPRTPRRYNGRRPRPKNYQREPSIDGEKQRKTRKRQVRARA